MFKPRIFPQLSDAGDAIFHVQGQQLGVRFIGANPEASITGLEPTAAKVNFFLGIYRLEDGCAHVLQGGLSRPLPRNRHDLRSKRPASQIGVLVAPHADPALIRLQYSEPVSLDAQGNLISGDLFREDAPEIYQQIAAQRVKIAGRYRLLDRYTVGFEVGQLRRIDPSGDRSDHFLLLLPGRH